MNASILTAADLSADQPFCRYDGRNALFVQRQGEAIQIRIPKVGLKWVTAGDTKLKACTGDRHKRR